MRHLSHDPSFKSCKELIEILGDFQISVGMSTEASAEILTAFQNCDLSKITKEVYFPQEHPELKAELQIWGRGGTKTSLKPAIGRLGLRKSEVEVQQMADAIAAGQIKEYTQGAVPQMPLVLIVAQKV
jgi:hypothetical protein